MNYYGETAAAAELSTGSIIFFLIIGFASLVAAWKLYEKAGVPGIMAIIPIVNLWCMCKIAKISPALIVLLLVPVVNIFVAFYINYKFAEAFGRSPGYCIAYVFFGGLLNFHLAFSNEVQYVA